MGILKCLRSFLQTEIKGADKMSFENLIRYAEKRTPWAPSTLKNLFDIRVDGRKKTCSREGITTECVLALINKVSLASLDGSLIEFDIEGEPYTVFLDADGFYNVTHIDTLEVLKVNSEGDEEALYTDLSLKREFYLNNVMIGPDQFVIDILIRSILETDKEAYQTIFVDNENYEIDTFNHGNTLVVRYNGTFIELSFKLDVSTKNLTDVEVHEYLIDLSQVISCGVNVLRWIN